MLIYANICLIHVYKSITKRPGAAGPACYCSRVHCLPLAAFQMRRTGHAHLIIFVPFQHRHSKLCLITRSFALNINCLCLLMLTAICCNYFQLKIKLFNRRIRLFIIILCLGSSINLLIFCYCIYCNLKWL